MAGITLGLVLIAARAWMSGDAGEPSPAGRSVPADPAATTEQPSRGAVAKGNGLFGEPLARGERTVQRRPAPDLDEDAPATPSVKARRADRAARRRRARDGGSDGAPGTTDHHALFSADLVTPYPTATESTLPELPLRGDSGTISLWIQPLWVGPSQDDATLVRFGDDRVRLVKNVSYLRFEAVDRDGRTPSVGTSIADWQAGEWHQVVATWDGRAITLYVDGVPAPAAASQEAPLDLPPGTPVYVGSGFPAGRPVASAVIAGVTIRDRALTPGVISRRLQTGPRPGD